MNKILLAGTAIAALLASSASASMVRGTITDSITGVPVSNVKVVFYQVIGEIDRLLDSSVTGTDGRYAFTGPAGAGGLPVGTGSGLYVYTVHNEYYFHSSGVYLRDSVDTVAQDIRLRRVSTMAETAGYREMAENGAAGSPGVAAGMSRRTSIGMFDVKGRLLPGTMASRERTTASAGMVVVKTSGAAARSVAVPRGGSRP